MLQTKEIILLIVAIILAVVICLFGYYFVYLPSTVQPSTQIFEEDMVTNGSRFPELLTNEDYVEGSELYRQRDFKGAANEFAAAKENTTSISEAMSVAQMEAAAQLNAGSFVTAVRLNKELIANEKFPDDNNFKTYALESLVEAYHRSPTDEVYKEIFYGTPDIFSPLVAEATDYAPAEDLSIQNLYEYGEKYLHATPELKLKVAEGLLSVNFDIYDILFKDCREHFNKAADACTPDIAQLLTPEQQTRFDSIVAQAEPLITEAIAGMDTYREYNMEINLAATTQRLARVAHKAMYYGIGTARQTLGYGGDAIVAAEAASDERRLMIANYEVAIFTVLLYLDPSPVQLSRVHDLLRPLYESDGRLAVMSDEQAATLHATYKEAQEELFNSDKVPSPFLIMSIRGQLALAKADPGYKTYLEKRAGWNFTSDLVNYFQ